MNLKQALEEIYSCGLSDAEIGRRVGAAQSIVHRLRNGEHKTTSFDRGKKIMELHLEIFSNKKPTRPSQSLSAAVAVGTTSTGA